MINYYYVQFPGRSYTKTVKMHKFSKVCLQSDYGLHAYTKLLIFFMYSSL